MTTSNEEKSQQWNDGLTVYTEMFGEDRARNRLNTENSNERRLTDLLFEYAYGSVWGNETLSHRERSLMTVALLAGLGRNEELESHIEGAVKNDCTIAELYEVMIHVALYSGFPAGLNGHRILKRFEQS